MKYVDGSSECPDCFTKDDAGKLTNLVNPAYDAWIQDDQMILGWINGSLTPFVLSTVARSTSSRSTWVSLAKRYASPSQNRILQLRSELLRTTRGDLSISDFLDRINSIADNLALSGSPISDPDLVSIIMNTVGATYEMTVSSAQARDTPITYDDLEALLLSAERRLLTHNIPSLDTGATALFASRPRGNFNRGRGFSRGGLSRGGVVGRGGSFLGPRSFGSASGGTPRSPRGGSSAGYVRSQCQICERMGHTAIDCFNRMNMSYEGRVPTKRLSAMVAGSSLQPSSSTWMTDTGANSHVTADLGLLQQTMPYHGPERVGGVGHDTGLPINHIGSSVLSSNTTKFKLNDVLHCSKASTNLLSVNKFSIDNEC